MKQANNVDNWTIYHNPRCSKSRQTLKILQDNNIEPLIIEYLKNPPSVDTINRILNLLDVPASDLIRKKEKNFKELNIDLNDKNHILEILSKNPNLIERPIVVKNNKEAVIGRPPELVLGIIKV
jgi:arsenate reductase (glutaredoxin)